PRLDPELRWTTVLRLCAAGVLGADDIEAELARDASAAGQESAARCRAALPDQAAKERAWQQMFADGALSKPLLEATASGFWQPGQEPLTDGFVERYFADIPAGTGRGTIVARALAHYLFPRYVVTSETVELAERCLDQADLAPDLRRPIADQLDDLRRAVRIRARVAVSP
ncbi:MAG TPA: ERAP1-like C-terminal domain-containing protein, partial [Actinopolymorphaceae bacterium]|nr:ERAP1-like C-terminal domain-containing protein [Actinopolymorphaceae bacterium]